jgi:hypothetical protein
MADVLPMDIGVECFDAEDGQGEGDPVGKVAAGAGEGEGGGWFDVVLPRLTKLPAVATRVFRCADSNQRGITVELFEGNPPPPFTRTTVLLSRRRDVFLFTQAALPAPAPTPTWGGSTFTSRPAPRALWPLCAPAADADTRTRTTTTTTAAAAVRAARRAATTKRTTATTNFRETC